MNERFSFLLSGAKEWHYKLAPLGEIGPHRSAVVGY